ncbi:MAG: sensor histidine kinase [Propionibacteriaceae bacterium]
MNTSVNTQPPSLAKGSLSRQLILRVVALVALLSLLMGALASAAIYVATVRSLDSDLSDSARREFDSGRKPGGDNPRFQHAGKAVGTIAITQDSTGVITASQVTDDVSQPVITVSGNDLATLLATPHDGKNHTTNLSTGLYRVISCTQRPSSDIPEPILRPNQSTLTQPALVVIALPMSGVQHQMTAVLLAEFAIATVASIASIFFVRGVVRSSLKPLHKLAAAANDVTKLELDKGDVELPIRVPISEAQPTEVVGLSNAFNHMLDHVDHALTSRHISETKVRQFVADASHELRNPLASIRGYSEITRRERDLLPTDTAFAMSRIEAESERMSALVEDMLLLAHLDNQPVLAISDVDLTELIVMAVSDAHVAGPDHQWRLDLPDEPVIAPADQHRLQQVVVNLLTNARTHTPAGTVVTTSCRLEEDHALLVVTDNGPGIPAELQEKVFERFMRADPSRQRNQTGGSSGLGLAIARGVVEAHGGSIICCSNPGDTRFEIRLPLRSVATKLL